MKKKRLAFLSCCLAFLFGMGMMFAHSGASLAWAGEAAHAPAAAGEAAPGVHGTAHASEPGMFDFSPAILVSQVINFFVLLFLLNKLLYGPINGMIEQRKTHIDQTIQAAENQKAEALKLKGEYESRLSKVEEELYQMKQKAIMEARTAEDEIMKKARSNSEKMIEKACKDITLERQKAWVQLREEVVKLAMLGAEKVVEKSLDDPAHHELIRKAIAELEEEV